MTSAISRRNKPDLPLLSVVREKGVVPRSTMSKDENHNYVPDDLSNYKVVRAGNLVINKMKAWQGSLGIAPIDGIVSPAYYVFELAIENRLYGQALLRSRTYVDYFARESDGVRIGQWDLSVNGMRRIPVAVPPPDEQAAIVRFLDHADRRIRRYIRAKQKLIKLLEEQKQAIIHQAVTRGLDQSVRLRQSGVSAIGEIPEHWSILQSRRVLSFVTSGSRGWAQYYSDGGSIFLQSGNLGRSMGLNLSSVQRVALPENVEGKRTEVRRDDLLVCITGALTGNSAVVDVDLDTVAFINQHVALCRPRPDVIHPRFLAYLFHSTAGLRQLKSSEYGGTKQGLGLDDVKSVALPVPPLPEQRSICAHLDRATTDLRLAIERTDVEMGLLRELRTRLIADVVTGQLDVRAAAAALPDEPADDEPIDDADESDGEDLDAEAAPEDGDA